MVVFSVLIISGCTKEEQVSETKTVECSLNRNDTINNYSLESSYKIYYNDDIVSKVETVEKVTSDNQDIITTFENTFNNTYSKMNEAYGGYTYDVNKTENEVTSTVEIDYTKLDLEKLYDDEPTMKNIMNEDKKILLDELKATYEAMGATCN